MNAIIFIYYEHFFPFALFLRSQLGTYFHLLILFMFLFFKHFIYLFLERGREGEEHPCVVASHVPPAGDLARSPGMCPDWESNQRPFALQAGTQSTEPHQPGPYFHLFNIDSSMFLPYAYLYIEKGLKGSIWEE